MNKILISNNWILKKNSSLIRPEMMPVKFFTKDSNKDKDKPDFDVEERYKGQDAVLHDKHQSVQEESFFHKETQEQLKALKKKKKNKTDTEQDNKK